MEKAQKVSHDLTPNFSFDKHSGLLLKKEPKPYPKYHEDFKVKHFGLGMEATRAICTEVC